MRRTTAVPPADEWGWVIAASGLAVLTEVGIRTLGLPRLARLLGTPLRSGAVGDPHPAVVVPPRPLPQADRRRVRATRRVMRHWPFGDTCLRQALVSGALLRHRSPRLVVGVAKLDGEIRAHAWLDIDGAVLDPMGAASSYTPLAPVGTGESS